MEIYLIRHTTPKIALGTCYGRSDIPVGDDFEKELQTIVEKLPGQVDSIFSSPLLRCKELAGKIAASFDDPTEFKIDDRLVEMNFGKWELKKWCEIPREEFAHWEKDVVLNAPPNGESFSELYLRVNDFFQELIKTDHQNVIVISHAGVIRCLLSIINNISLLDTLKITIDYGALNIFSV